MEFLTPYLPYIISAALAWAASSRSGIYLPWLDPPVPVMPIPKTGRPGLDLVLALVWRLLPDDKVRELVAEEAKLIAKALDHYKVDPIFKAPPS